MKALSLLASSVLPLLLSCGCSNLNHTENGALAGGAIGAGTGALVGHALGHTAGGALIGAGVGALSGGLIGNSADNAEKRAEAAAQARHPMGMVDVVQMAQSHVSDDLIISEVRATGSVFRLSAQDTIWLKQNGVSDVVVQEMVATAYRYPRRYYSVEPVYVEPAPVAVGVGVGFHGGH
jgi:hypothetical protein